MAKVYLFSGKEWCVMNTPTIFDIAQAFLTMESMTNKKLQKLCYYAQAWHLAFYKRPLVNATFEAWVHGPVCPELYRHYKTWGWVDIPLVTSIPGAIDHDTSKFLHEIYNTYGEFSGDQLEVLTHSEKPWKEARVGLEEWEPSNNQIDNNTMLEYYRNIYETS